MEDLFKNKYRISSNRMRKWDYAGNGHYFITSVTASRQELFGEIVNNRMVLNDFGKIVYDEFFKSLELRRELYLGEFILMPNHWHAIIILDKSICTDLYQKIQSSQKQKEYFPLIRKPKSISSFIGGFKSSAISQIDNFIDNNNLKIPKFNKLNPLWQPNYYDHIIRDSDEYNKIADYIITNPQNWGNDMFSKH
ncbi:MAG: hypothetical protein J5614_07905 [Paludibacteraceae bacterium]|nr:hypothetical protein [Paludibacteraceae bacterium]